MQAANMVENKQCRFRFNNFIDEISTIHFLISHLHIQQQVWTMLPSSLQAIMMFSGSTRFPSDLQSG